MTNVKKCLHDGTHNFNESFHNMIWMRCPKFMFAGRTRLEVGVYEAVIVFNDGELVRMDIFNKLGLSV